jgi:hypothetical protein
MAKCLGKDCQEDLLDSDGRVLAGLKMRQVDTGEWAIECPRCTTVNVVRQRQTPGLGPTVYDLSRIIKT